MSGSAPPEELARLAGLVERVTGNVVPDSQLARLYELAVRCAREAGLPDLKSYLDLLEASGSGRHWRRLLPAVTVKESFLFRIPEHFEALCREILPLLARARGESHRLRLWSAGCARGEEPATLALVLAECPATAERSWQIVATDVDDEALALARRGVYGERAVARVPPHLLRFYFERQGEEWALSPELRHRIDFRSFNFFRVPYLRLGPPFDVIFLRNVLIYFRDDSQRQVIGRVVSRLAPDGYLFLGHSESLWYLNDEMETVELDGCFAYRRRSSPARRPPPPSVKAAAPVEPPAPPPEAARPAVAPRAAVADAGGGAGPEQDLAAAARALGDDRLDDARRLVAACLAARPDHAEAHALSGLLHDLEGDAEAAVAAYRAALYLEPDLFQVRFLLAHRIAHLGRTRRARHEYRRLLGELENGRGRELGVALPHLLPGREAAARRCRRALSGPARPRRGASV